MSVLAAEGLHTFYGKSHILHGVGLTVGEGEIVTLLGRNGAGKTTTLRSLIGLTPARQGTVHIFGQATTAWPPDRIVALGVGYVPEGRRVFGSLTVEENLLVPIERPGPWNIARVYELFPRLGERRRQLAGTLSGGEQRMLSLARVLVRAPKLLITDELSLGLAPVIIDEVYETLGTIKESGTALLIVEQHIHQALTLADHVVVMAKGRISLSGSCDELGDITERIIPAVQGERVSGNGTQA